MKASLKSSQLTIFTMEPEEDEDNNGKNDIETSVLNKKPLKVFGHPLTNTQQMWLGFMVPAFISTIIFMSSIALDIAVAYQLLRDGHPLLAGGTIMLVYTPSIVCLVLTLMSNPKLDRICDRIIWTVIQFLQCILFPVGIIHRFATRLFWSVVALTEENPQREKALSVAAASHHTEIFFFLDSFLNAAPQALLQAYILLSPQIVTTNETGWTQAISIVTSVITVSKTVALYQRFESQQVVGRPVPWKTERTESHTKSLVRIKKIDPYHLMGIENPNEEGKQISIRPKLSLVINPTPDVNFQQETNQQEEMHENLESADATQKNVEDKGTNPEENKDQRSEQKLETGEEANTEYRDDDKQNRYQEETKQEPKESDDLLPTPAFDFPPQATTSHYLVPITIEPAPLEELCFWPRINTPPSSPTADPHMRPRLSINTIRSQNRPAYTSQVALPLRKPSTRIKGLHEDEPLGIFTVFHAWSAFLLGRVLVIAAFTHFYFWPSLGLLLGHYTIMTAYIFFCNPCPNFWAILLGFIFILCPIEVKVRYKFPRIFLVFFFALVFLEDLATVILWYCGAEWESTWYDFAFAFILGCHGTAALNGILYFFMFKPKAKYLDNSKA